MLTFLSPSPVGTRWMCTKEAPMHQKIKQKIVDSDERDTIHVFRTLHNTARIFKNKVAEEVVAIENRPGGAQFADVQHLVNGQRGREVYESGDVNRGIWFAGETLGLIHDIVSGTGWNLASGLSYRKSSKGWQCKLRKGSWKAVEQKQGRSSWVVERKPASICSYLCSLAPLLYWLVKIQSHPLPDTAFLPRIGG